jgi:hypothetical protein|tara:strand:+ start:4278 stop:4457 length:180 start_codon:yes stop_codon:yes gene_type:complete
MKKSELQDLSPDPFLPAPFLLDRNALDLGELMNVDISEKSPSAFFLVLSPFVNFARPLL